MKMKKQTFDELHNAIDKVLSHYSSETVKKCRQNIKFVDNQFISFCWHMFYVSKFDCKRLYAEGLHDDHIETALKHILSNFEI